MSDELLALAKQIVLSQGHNAAIRRLARWATDLHAENEGIKGKLSSLGRISAGWQSRADKAEKKLAAWEDIDPQSLPPERVQMVELAQENAVLKAELSDAEAALEKEGVASDDMHVLALEFKAKLADAVSSYEETIAVHADRSRTMSGKLAACSSLVDAKDGIIERLRAELKTAHDAATINTGADKALFESIAEKDAEIERLKGYSANHKTIWNLTSSLAKKDAAIKALGEGLREALATLDYIDHRSSRGGHKLAKAQLDGYRDLLAQYGGGEGSQ